MLLAEVSKGMQVMAYSDFAAAAYPKNATRVKYDTLAAELFRRGFDFYISPKGTSGRFKKEVNGDGIQVAIVGEKAPSYSNRQMVMVSFTVHDANIAGGLRDRHQNYEIDDMIDDGADLDFILSGGDH